MSESRTYYKLTHSQKGIWYTEKLYPGTSINNIAATLKINGSIDYYLLEKAILIFIDKNNALKLRFTEIDGEPYQYLSEEKYSEIEYKDFSMQDRSSMFEWDTQESHKPFKIMDSCLFHFAIIKMNENESGFYFKSHHLISDGWSIIHTGNEILRYYNCLKNGEAIEESNKPSYVDFLNKEEEYEKSPKFEKDRDYWLNVFETLPEMTTLKKSTVGTISTKARRNTQIIPGRLSNKIQEYCKENKTSVFALYLAALAIYINRVTGKEDLVIGVPVLNRSTVQEKDTIGMFISTVPLRINVNNKHNFREFSDIVSRIWLSALKHHKYPHDYLLREVREKFKSSDELYDIVLSYQNAKFVRSELTYKHEGRWHFNGHQKQSLYIHINDREDEGNLIVDYDYLVDVFYSKEIEFIQDHLTRLLWHALDNPVKQISMIDMLSENEKNKIIYEFNKTELEYPKDLTIYELFERQVKETPESVAVVFHDEFLTYKELDNKADKLAAILRSKGVGPEEIIGVATKRSLEMIIGILGILKAGAAYLPLDPDYPNDRIMYMLEDSKARILLVYGIDGMDYQFEGETINISDVAEGNLSKRVPADTVSETAVQCTPDNLAYVIYTSGSTGKPKGVMIQNRSVVNFITGMRSVIDFSSGRSILSVTTLCFDIFVLETLHSLCCGLKVFIADENEQKIPSLLSKVITENNVEMLQTTPSRINMIMEDTESAQCFSKLSTMMIGGEAFPELLLKKLTNITKARIYNMYGPTETTVWSTVKELTGQRDINIGRPICNTQIYILDKMLQPVPIGFCGELYIGGDGLARGYINLPELTNERFIENPFIKGDKIYRTGDLARWFPKGEIEHLGRADFQLKIRGFRIEPGEIESRLMEYNDISAVTVVDKVNSEGMQYLCAYFVSESDLNVKELRSFLLKKLPGYMVPAHFVKVDKIPLTPNGKIDKKKLRDMESSFEPEKAVRAFNETVLNDTELKLMNICRELLKNNDISIADSFLESGGDSLSTLALSAYIQKEFKSEVAVDVINKAESIREIAQYISANEKNFEYVIPKAEKSEYYPVSSPQKRIFILDQIDRNKLSYNMPFALKLEGELNRITLQKAINILAERHEALRSCFRMEDSMPVLRVLPSLSIKLSYVRSRTDNMEVIVKDFVKPFELGTAPLIRFRLVDISESRHVLLIDMHHIISDRASVNILVKELFDVYSGKALPELPIQYKDYSVYQKTRLSTGFMEKEREFWLGVFNGELPVLNLPLDYQRPEEQQFEGDKLSVEVNGEVYNNVKTLARNNNATIFMVLLAVYSVLLSKLSGQEDIIIGSPVSCRNSQDLNSIIGMFVNTIALRNKPAADKKFKDFLSEVRENVNSALANKDYPFEEMIKELKIERDLSRNPLFSVMLSYNNDLSAINVPNLKAEPVIINNGISKFDITLEAYDNGKSIDLVFEFCTALFKKKTIEKIAGGFIDFLSMINSSDTLIGDMCINNESGSSISAEADGIMQPERLLNNKKAGNHRNIENEIIFEAPNTPVEKKVAEVWSEVLSINVNKISVNDNFFELGGDSLAVIRIQTKLAGFNWKLDTQDFYKYQTIKHIAQRINHYLTYAFEEVSCVSECNKLKTEETIDLRSLPAGTGRRSDFKNILLTGVTGYLGIHLLHDFIKTDDLDIYCIIRGKDLEACKKRLSDLMDFYFNGEHKEMIGKRIHVICGDISAPHLGIDEKTYNLLGRVTDAIVHSAAVVKHYGDCSLFNVINVQGTNQIIKFAENFDKTLFHISTMSVSGVGFPEVEMYADKSIFTEHDFYIGQDYCKNAYVESKYRAEKLVYEAVLSGLDAYVLRMGNLTGRYADGYFQKNMQENAFYNRLKALINLCVVPESLYKTDVELTPVDYASKTVADIVMSKDKNSRVYHLYNPNYISLDNIIEMLSDLKINIKVVSESDFRNTLTALQGSMSEKDLSLLMLIHDIEKSGISYTGKRVRTENQSTCSYLNKMGFSWPMVDNNYISKLINYAKQVSFI